MKCPRCEQKLQKELFSGIIRYSCPHNHGSLTTFAALRSLHVDQESLNELWRNAIQGNFIYGAPCPQCGKKMRMLELADGEFHFDLDICISCQTVWFDHGETEHLPVLPPEETENLPQRAKEILAEYQTRQLADKTDNDSNTPPDSCWKILPALLGMPVKTDHHPVMRRPYLTWGIAAVCIIVFAVTFRNLEFFIRKFGFTPQNWTALGGITILTSAFIHVDLVHLLGNTYFLLGFGGNVEDAFGRRNYLILLFTSGLFATATYAVSARNPALPVIGASGFISGIIAAYAITFPRAKLSFLIRCRWISIYTWVAFALWVIYQTVAFFVNHNSPIAYAAHLGGMIPGIVFAIAYKIRRKH